MKTINLILISIVAIVILTLLNWGVFEILTSILGVDPNGTSIAILMIISVLGTVLGSYKLLKNKFH